MVKRLGCYANCIAAARHAGCFLGLFNQDGAVKSCLSRYDGIFAERKSVSTLADRRREKGVSLLQEALYASISARKPAFPHLRQGKKVQFRKSAKKGLPWKS